MNRERQLPREPCYVELRIAASEPARYGGDVRKKMLMLCLAALPGRTPESPFGLRLPDGDATADRQTFVDEHTASW